MLRYAPMFGSIGGPELLVIFLVALLIFGPRKLPELGKTLGKSLGEFRRAANDLRVSLETEVANEAAAKSLTQAPAGVDPAGTGIPEAPAVSGPPGAAEGPAPGADRAPSAGPLTPAPAPGAVARPRSFAPGQAEVEAAANPAAPDAPEPDGREPEEPR